MARDSAISTGMYSGRHPAITPFTATLQGVASRPSGCITPSVSWASQIGEAKERVDALHGGRNDGQSVAPAVLVVQPVDLVEAALEYHVTLARLVAAGQPRPGTRSGSQ